jgi:alkanesulfonate monooxygenase SsuD/methylene tetrahydromethanopterin reductase-like flavin-dependent oxidoreductase (luciferase family)
MINKFMTVYAGHIDIPDHGQDATPANDRRYKNDQLASVFDKTEAIAKVMDELGYDTMWLAEHHFQHEGYECLPNILMCAVHLAHVTKQLRIGCGFNIAPMWHPLRLAEDYATADILTKGRTVFGVGRGLSQPRSGNVWRPDHRPGGEPRIVRRAGRDRLQGVQQRILFAQGQALRDTR